MMARPRITCGQNMAVEVGLRGLEGAEPEAEREEREAAGGQQARVEPLLQHDGDRGHGELRDAGHQHDRADLQRVVAAHEGEEHRHQVDRAEEADPEHEAEQAADREAAVGEVARSTIGSGARQARRRTPRR